MLHSIQLSLLSKVPYDAPLPRFRHFLQARQQAMRRVRGTEMAAARITEPAIHTNITYIFFKSIEYLFEYISTQFPPPPSIQ
jgi:hypothetical protein